MAMASLLFVNGVVGDVGEKGIVGVGRICVQSVLCVHVDGERGVHCGYIQYRVYLCGKWERGSVVTECATRCVCSLYCAYVVNEGVSCGMLILYRRMYMIVGSVK